MKNYIKNFNPKKDILIIGNSTNVLQFELGEFIDKNFFTIRFKTVSKKDRELEIKFKDNVLENKKYTGSNIDMIFKKFTPFKYFENKELIKVISKRNIINEYKKKYKRKISRGLIAILVFLQVYEYNNINKPIYIHGFSFNRNNIYNENFNDLKNMDMGKNDHNYNIEKEIIYDLISKDKVKFLLDIVK